MAERELTLKQKKFIAAYLGEAAGNATEAARIAGYKSPHPEGHRLLQNATIRAHITEHVSKYVATADDVLAELRDVGFAEWRDFVEVLKWDKNGEPLSVRMDLSNKVKALELLGKYHQLFVERQDINVNIREHRVIGIADGKLAEMFQPADPPELNA